MEKFLLLKQLIDVDDINKIIFKHIIMNVDNFQYGRMCQLIIDRSKNITEDKYSYRREKCASYMKSKTKDDVILEAYTIINKFQNKRKYKIYNEWHDLNISTRISEFIPKNLEYRDLNDFDICIETSQQDYFIKRSISHVKHEDACFYLGRCIQFLLDTNNKINIHDLFIKTYSEIINQAHDLKELILMPKEGDELRISGCDSCSTWYIGSRRCECGNRRCSLIHDSVGSLDNTSLNAYGECY